MTMFLATLMMVCTVCQAEYYHLEQVLDWPFVDSPPFAVHRVSNILQCARFCSMQSNCTSFVTDCVASDKMEETDCNLSNSTVLYDNLMKTGHLCCAQVVKADINFTTVAGGPSTTAMMPTTSHATTVIDFVWGVRDMCYVGSSSDLLVLTDAGVYIYEDYTVTVTPPCKGPLPLSDVFPGYTSLPTISSLRAIMLYQGNMVEMYSHQNVFQWQVSGGSQPLQYQNYGIQEIRAYLGMPSSSMRSFNWACYRGYNSMERQYSLNSGRFRVITSSTQQTYDQVDALPDSNNYNLNPWEEIPADTVALTGYGSSPDTTFLLVTTSLDVYTYRLRYAGLTLMESTLVHMGTMVFS